MPGRTSGDGRGRAAAARRERILVVLVDRTAREAGIGSAIRDPEAGEPAYSCDSKARRSSAVACSRAWQQYGVGVDSAIIGATSSRLNASLTLTQSSRRAITVARKAPESLSPWWLIAVGVAAAPGTLAAAGQDRKLRRRGSAQALTAWTATPANSWRSVPLGDLRWSLAPMDLLRGRLAASCSSRAPSSRGSAYRSGGCTSPARPPACRSSCSLLPIGMPRTAGRLSAQFGRSS
jgi:hypothetical protein